MYKKLPKNKWSVLAIAAVIAAILWFAFGKSGTIAPVANSVNVTVAPVVRKDVPIQVPLVGTVVAYETVSVKSRLDSQVMNVHFRDGDNVKEGQALFDLDDRAIKAQIQQFAAALSKEKAQLVNAELQYRRSQNLIKTNVVAQAQVDETKAAYEAQAAQVNAAQANLDNASVQLSYTTITAPISGRTGTINVTRGNTVKANDAQPLVTINQITPIRVQFAIPQRYYDQVKTALSQGNVEVKAKNKESTSIEIGRLEYVDNAIDVSNGTFAVRAVFDNKEEKLWPGMFVNITLDLGLEKNALAVPAVAIQGDDAQHFIFLADMDTKKAIRRPVDVSLNNGDIAVITKGLTENDQVIVDGLLHVTDGASIAISAAPAETQPVSESPVP